MNSRTSAAHKRLMPVALSGCISSMTLAACKTTPSTADTPMASSTPTAAPNDERPASPTKINDDSITRFIQYQHDLAPLTRRAIQIVNDPTHSRNAKKIADAIIADEQLKQFDRVRRRAAERFKLSREELAAAAALVSDPKLRRILDSSDAAEAAAAESELVAEHGPDAAGLAARHRDTMKSLRTDVDPGTQRPIDCGRQPDSCSCNPCPPLCEIPGYQECIEKCTLEFALCMLQEPGLGWITCGLKLNACGLDCGDLPPDC